MVRLTDNFLDDRYTRGLREHCRKHPDLHQNLRARDPVIRGDMWVLGKVRFQLYNDAILKKYREVSNAEVIAVQTIYVQYRTTAAHILHHDLNKQRVRTFVHMLSDTEYGGGLLRIPDLQEEHKLTFNQLIDFPAKLYHDVTPVTNGVREVLVSWVSARED